jgi:hypothetical protein
MSEQRLCRWIDARSDASPELRGALRELEGESGDAERIERLEVRLAAALGADFGPVPSAAPPPANGSATTAGPASSGAALVAKVGLFAVVGVAALAGASVLATRTGVETLGSSSRVAGLRVEHRMISVRDDLAWPLATASSLAEPTDGARAPRARVVAAESRENAAPSASVAPIGSVSEEARLLRAARAESKNASTSRALALLDEHERRFPRGVLGDERELFAIELLIRAGKRAEASERLNELRTRSPSSPYLGIAERMLGDR